MPRSGICSANAGRRSCRRGESGSPRRGGRGWLARRAGKGAPRFIALVGLRGAGKSTVGAQLARRLKAEFVELDALIEKGAGISLGEIFALHGEEYYRRLERAELSKLLARSRGCV